jgi:hypothetical protein
MPPVILAEDRHLTKENFHKYVGFQPKNVEPVAFVMQYVVEDWTERIGNMDVEEIYDHFHPSWMSVQTKISLHVTKIHTECNLSLDQALCEAESILNSFPPTDMVQHIARNRIAANSRRGAGNTFFADSVYYKGTTNEIDSPVIIVQFDGKFGICKHPLFQNYGFVITNV